MVVVAKLDVGLFQFAAPFHENLVRAVDQNITDRRVLEEHLQRPKAEGFVEHLIDQALSLHAVQKRIFGIAQPLDHQADLFTEGIAFQVADARQVELIHQLAMDQAFEFLKALVRLAFQALLAAAQPLEATVVTGEAAQASLQTRHGCSLWGFVFPSGNFRLQIAD